MPQELRQTAVVKTIEQQSTHSSRQQVSRLICSLDLVHLQSSRNRTRAQLQQHPTADFAMPDHSEASDKSSNELSQLIRNRPSQSAGEPLQLQLRSPTNTHLNKQVFIPLARTIFNKQFLQAAALHELIDHRQIRRNDTGSNEWN